MEEKNPPADCRTLWIVPHQVNCDLFCRINLIHHQQRQHLFHNTATARKYFTNYPHTHRGYFGWQAYGIYGIERCKTLVFLRVTNIQVQHHEILYPIFTTIGHIFCLLNTALLYLWESRGRERGQKLHYLIVIWD